MVNLIKRIKGFGLTGIILMASVAVSCIDSPDEKGSQNKETEILETTASLALAAPADWNCDKGFYGSNDGCHCGCGVIDPDCKDGIGYSNQSYKSFSVDACDYRNCENDVYSNLNHLCHEDEVKIMPVGDSITAGEHFDAPAIGIRTGYRKDLKKYLLEEFYNVDFVGSQEHGKLLNYDWHNGPYDWQNEAYPSAKISAITAKLKNALPKDRPDILLIHVGTNGLGSKQVTGMLDVINSTPGKIPTWVLLCKIINRFDKDPKKTGTHPATTQFNKEVAKDVAERKGDKFQIVMVDMENGAGFNYSDNPDTGDMWGTKYVYPKNHPKKKLPPNNVDPYHPNDHGNRKMANKFLEVLMSTALQW